MNKDEFLKKLEERNNICLHKYPYEIFCNERNFVGPFTVIGTYEGLLEVLLTHFREEYGSFYIQFWNKQGDDGTEIYHRMDDFGTMEFIFHLQPHNFPISLKKLNDNFLDKEKY